MRAVRRKLKRPHRYQTGNVWIHSDHCNWVFDAPIYHRIMALVSVQYPRLRGIPGRNCHAGWQDGRALVPKNPGKNDGAGDDGK